MLQDGSRLTGEFKSCTLLLRWYLLCAKEHGMYVASSHTCRTLNILTGLVRRRTTEIGVARTAERGCAKFGGGFGPNHGLCWRSEETRENGTTEEDDRRHSQSGRGCVTLCN